MYVKLHSAILASSVWSLDKDTRLAWVALLAAADREGYVRGSPSGLARIANLTPAEWAGAMAVLMAPDPEDHGGEHDGRRVLEVEPGVLHLPRYAYYRDLKDADEQRAGWRERQRKRRGAELPTPSRNVTDCHTPSPSVTPSDADTDSDTDTKDPPHTAHPDVAFVLEHLTTEPDSTAFTQLLRAAANPAAFAATVRGLAPAGIEHIGTWPQVGQALRDVATAGGRVSANFLRGCVRKAAEPVSRNGQSKGGGQQARNLAVIARATAAIEAEEAVGGIS